MLFGAYFKKEHYYSFPNRSQFKIWITILWKKKITKIVKIAIFVKIEIADNRQILP